MDTLELFKRAGENTTKFIENIKDDQWDKMSNDDPWTVRDLVNHITAGNLWVKPLVEGKTIAEVGDQFDGDVLGDDPVGAWKRSLQEAIDAFSSEGAMKNIVHLSYGDFPGESYAKDMSFDNLIHGWDVAVSTGQPDDLPADLVETVWSSIKDHIDEFESSGMFGKRVEVPETSDLQTKLLGAIGRDRKKLAGVESNSTGA